MIHEEFVYVGMWHPQCTVGSEVICNRLDTDLSYMVVTFNGPSLMHPFRDLLCLHASLTSPHHCNDAVLGASESPYTCE